MTDEEQLRTLLGLDEADQVDQERLDNLVHDCKGGEAAGINNSGREEQLSYILSMMGDPIQGKRMRLEEWVRSAMDEINADARFHYDTANPAVNAPLALIQTALRSRMGTLKEVLKQLEKDG